MGPATGYPQPATGMVVVLAGTIPGQLHLDPAVFVTVDFTVDRAGDHRALIPRYRWARLLRQRRTKHRIPWRGDKCVAIALAQFPSVLLGDRLLQHLGLLAFMAHLRHQPQVIPVLAGCSRNCKTGHWPTPAHRPGRGHCDSRCGAAPGHAGRDICHGCGRKSYRGSAALQAWAMTRRQPCLQLDMGFSKVVIAQVQRRGPGRQLQGEALDRGVSATIPEPGR